MPRILVRLLDRFESAAYRRIVDAQIYGDFVELIPVLVCFGYRFVSTVFEYPL